MKLRRRKKGKKNGKARGVVEASLSPEDLLEFRIRRAAIEQAALASSMMQAGYKIWADALKERYSIPGAFDVDLNTGRIHQREAADG